MPISHAKCGHQKLKARLGAHMEVTGFEMKEAAEAALLLPVQALAGRAIVDVDVIILANVENPRAKSHRYLAVLTPRDDLGSWRIQCHVQCPRVLVDRRERSSLSATDAPIDRCR